MDPAQAQAPENRPAGSGFDFDVLVVTRYIERVGILAMGGHRAK